MSEIQSKPRVLIVDDNIKNIQVLGATLRNEGYQVMVAQSGQKALETVERMCPDLIVLDIIMPEMDGFECCQKLKAMPEVEEVPIIFLTARVEIEDVLQGFELGGVDYITKPFHQKELLVRVNTHIQLRLAQKKVQHQAKKLKKLLSENQRYQEYLEEEVIKRTLELEKNIRERVQIEEDLKMGAFVQTHFLPHALPQIDNLQFTSFSHPASDMGGDWYHLIQTDEWLYLMIGDVTGHGTAPALITAGICTTCEMLNQLMLQEAKSQMQPAEVLGYLNHVMSHICPAEFLMSCFVARLNLRNGLLQFANAAHNFPLIIHSDGSIKHLLNTNYLLGYQPKIEFQQAETQVLPDDTLLLFTDGCLEIEDNEKRQFGERKLIRHFKLYQTSTLNESVKKLEDILLKYRGQQRLEDDMTLLACKVLGPWPE